jgi:hypothetical protein
VSSCVGGAPSAKGIGQRDVSPSERNRDQQSGQQLMILLQVPGTVQRQAALLLGVLVEINVGELLAGRRRYFQKIADTKPAQFAAARTFALPASKALGVGKLERPLVSAMKSPLS